MYVSTAVCFEAQTPGPRHDDTVESNDTPAVGETRPPNWGGVLLCYSIVVNIIYCNDQTYYYIAIIITNVG